MSNVQPISVTWDSKCGPNKLEWYDETDQEKITGLFIGRSVTVANTDHLVLDDGTVLRLIGNEGGCSCGAGDYDLTELNGTENAITSVEFDDDPGGDDYNPPCRTCGKAGCYEDDHDNRGRYRIFVYAGNDRINLATFEGSDGNGYYGTGYVIYVRRPE